MSFGHCRVYLRPNEIEKKKNDFPIENTARVCVSRTRTRVHEYTTYNVCAVRVRVHATNDFNLAVKYNNRTDASLACGN